MRVFKLVTLISIILVTLVGGRDSALAKNQLQPNSRYFPETKQTVSGRFLEYWEKNGGLPQQGYPLSAEMQEQSLIDGKTYTVQYFERAVFEMHPENARPFDVLLQLLGVIRYRAMYPDGAPGQIPNNDPGSVVFPETGKRVGGSFLAYFNQHGGIPQQGLPISDEFKEVSPLDGRIYTVQYFERAVFEWHPSNTPPYNVLLVHLGRFALDARQAGGGQDPGGALPQPVVPEPLSVNKSQFGQEASSKYLVWQEGFQTGPSERGRFIDVGIRALDLRAGTAISVTAGLPEATSLAVDGSIAAWINNHSECGSCPPLGLYARDLVTGATYDIRPSAGGKYATYPAVAGRHVAWIENEGSVWRILVKNVDTGSISMAREVLFDEPNPTSLQGRGDMLAWGEVERITPETNTFRASIYTYRISTGALSKVYSVDVTQPQANLLVSFALGTGQIAIANPEGGLFVLDLAKNTRTDIAYSDRVEVDSLTGNILLFRPSLQLSSVFGVDLASARRDVVPVLAFPPGTPGPSRPIYNTAVADKWLIWSDIRGQRTMQVKDLSPLLNNRTAPLLPFSGKIQSMAAGSDRYVVWAESDPATSGGPVPGTSDIKAFDLWTNTPVTVTTDAGDQIYPAASGSLGLWQNDVTGCEGCPFSGLYYKDLDNSIPFDFEVVTRTHLLGFPQISLGSRARLAAWGEFDTNSQRVMLKDINTGRLTTVKQVNSPAEPAITGILLSDSYVVWNELIKPDNSRDPSAPSHIYAYDLAMGTTSAVLTYSLLGSSGGLPNYSLDGKRIAVQDVAGNLFVLDLATGVRTDLPYHGFAMGMILKGDLLLFSQTPARTDIYGINLRQPDKLVPVISAEPGTTAQYQFTLASGWLVDTDASEFPSRLEVRMVPDGLR
jgi:hypothetical protein